MGISSDGILLYGLIWKDDRTPWKEPTPAEFEKVGLDPEGSEGEPEWEDLYEMRSGKKLGACPVDVGVHCSYSHKMWFVGIKETVVRADRGHPQQAKILTVKPEWEAQLREFCEIMGIEWQTPAWWVASIYG